MILPIIGTERITKQENAFLAFTEEIKPPDKKPPFNAIKINDRYLLNDSGFFMGI